MSCKLVISSINHCFHRFSCIPTLLDSYPTIALYLDNYLLPVLSMYDNVQLYASGGRCEILLSMAARLSRQTRFREYVARI